MNEAAAFASVAKLNNNFEKALVLANESDNSFDLTKPLPSAVFSPYAFKIISLMNLMILFPSSALMILLIYPSIPSFS